MKALKRFLVAAVLLSALAVPAWASSTPITLLASAAQTASANGASIDVSGIKELTVFVNVTAQSGTFTAFRVYLESSDDQGVTWYELAADVVLVNGAAAPGAGTANQRDLVNKTTTVSVEKYTGTYTKFGSKVRAIWVLTGTTPSVTFSVKAIGKN